MPHPAVAKFTSVGLILVILAASFLGLCRETHAAEESWVAPAQAYSQNVDASSDEHCPACPHEEQSDADHCASSCYCSCHLPLTVQPVHIRFSPVVTDLIFIEPFKALPEVYLSKFIPPHILV